MAGLIAAAMAVLAPPAAAATLEDVRAREVLRCGVADDQPGFGHRAEHGAWSGFHVDFCRAVAAAVLGDGEAVEFVALTDRERFDAVTDGTVDLLSRHTVWTMLRDLSIGLSFPVATYFDGQGFLAKADMVLTSAKELSGTPICVVAGSRLELDLARFFRANAMAYNPVLFERSEDAVAAYEEGQCGAYTDTLSRLSGLRLTLAEPGAHIILDDIVARTSIGPVVRAGDETWSRLVRWVYFVLVDAEELDVTAGTIDDHADSEDHDVRLLLGIDEASESVLGLEPSWMADIISATGHYGEIFERNLGHESPFAMERGLNALWRDGGLHVAPLIR